MFTSWLEFIYFIRYFFSTFENRSEALMLRAERWLKLYVYISSAPKKGKICILCIKLILLHVFMSGSHKFTTTYLKKHIIYFTTQFEHNNSTLLYILKLFLTSLPPSYYLFHFMPFIFSSFWVQSLTLYFSNIQYFSIKKI